MRRKPFALAALLCLALVAPLGAGADAAHAKGIGAMIAPQGIAPPGSPFRYQTFSPGYPDELTVVTRADRAGGMVRRWWYLRGGFYVPAVAFDGTAGGLSADGRTLILVKHDPTLYETPRRTVLSIMETDRPNRAAPGEPRDPFVRFARLGGEWALLAVSPDGGTAYLSRQLNPIRRISPELFSPHVPGTDGLETRALDTASGRLLPGPVRGRDGSPSRLDGVPHTQASAGGGRWTYTLYVGDRRRPFVYALDGERGRGTRIDLPHLRGLREPYSLHLEVGEADRSLELVRRWFPGERRRERTVATIDTVTFSVQGPEPRAGEA